MEKKTIGIIAVVVVVIIAIAAIAVVVSNDDDDDKKKDLPEIAAGTGTVYGNADGNTYINQTDIDLIQAIIDGDRSFSDFPFADANCDGKVDSEDIEIVKKFINKETVTIKVLDTQDKIVDIVYPLNGFILLAGSSLAPLMNVLNCSDDVVAAAYSSWDSIRDHNIKSKVDSGAITSLTVKGTTADMDTISKLVKDKGVHTMLTEYSSMYALDDDDHVKTYNEWDIDVLELECRDPGQDTRSMAVFGILLDRGDRAQQYIDFVENIYSQIKEKEGSSWGTCKVLISSMASGLCGTSSGYTKMIEEMAGGKNVADWSDGSKKFSVGDTWIFESKYNCDVMFLGATIRYDQDGGVADSVVSGYKEKYSNLSVWKDGKVYTYPTNIPVVCRVAYYAELMYPDIFESGWANSVHQSFVDTFFEYPNFTVNQSQFIEQINI